MQPKGLYQLQKRFWEFIAAPEGVEKAIPEMKERDPEGVPLLNWIEAENEEAAIERLDVYAGMYFYRLFETLQDDYELVEKAIGKGHFHNLVVDYLLAHPSTYTSLFYLGQKMPEFLKSYTRIQFPPWIPELAALESALTETILMPDDHVLTLETLQALPPDVWSGICFQPIRALKVLESAFPLHRIWEVLNQDETIESVAPKESFTIVWRSEFRTDFLVLKEMEATAFRMLLDGEPFGVVCGAFIPENQSDEQEPDLSLIQDASQQAFQALSTWLERGMLTSYSLPEEV